jgi:hypothetical protein
MGEIDMENSSYRGGMDAELCFNSISQEEAANWGLLIHNPDISNLPSKWDCGL